MIPKHSHHASTYWFSEITVKDISVININDIQIQLPSITRLTFFSSAHHMQTPTHQPSDHCPWLQLMVGSFSVSLGYVSEFLDRLQLPVLPQEPWYHSLKIRINYVGILTIIVSIYLLISEVLLYTRLFVGSALCLAVIITVFGGICVWAIFMNFTGRWGVTSPPRRHCVPESHYVCSDCLGVFHGSRRYFIQCLKTKSTELVVVKAGVL
jgi:hypothetical protein